MVNILYCAIYFFFAVVVRAHLNYCNICEKTNSHTLCKYYVGPAVSCVGFVEARLSKEEKHRILNRFNERRNYVAGGNHQFIPPAANMLKMTWVEVLARAAQRWADQCRPPASPEETDTCRDLFSGPVAQIVTSLIGDSPGLRAESLVDMWYMQSLSYNGSATKYEATHNQMPFAHMIWTESQLVGCGRSKFMVQINGKLRTVERLVCNIAPAGFKPGTPFWLPGLPASRCSLGSDRDEQYTNLCSYKTTPEELSEVLNRIENALAAKPKSRNRRVLRELRITENIVHSATRQFQLQHNTDATKINKQTSQDDSFFVTRTKSISVYPPKRQFQLQNDTDATKIKINKQTSQDTRRQPNPSLLTSSNDPTRTESIIHSPKRQFQLQNYTDATKIKINKKTNQDATREPNVGIRDSFLTSTNDTIRKESIVYLVKRQFIELENDMDETKIKKVESQDAIRQPNPSILRTVTQSRNKEKEEAKYRRRTTRSGKGGCKKFFQKLFGRRHKGAACIDSVSVYLLGLVICFTTIIF